VFSFLILLLGFRIGRLLGLGLLAQFLLPFFLRPVGSLTFHFSRALKINFVSPADEVRAPIAQPARPRRYIALHFRAQPHFEEHSGKNWFAVFLLARAQHHKHSR
jgi:hypothetical protein